MQTNKKSALIAIGLLLSSGPAFAHRIHTCNHADGHVCRKFEATGDAEEIPLDPTSAETLRALLDDAHHSIEIEDEGGFFQRWRDKLDLKSAFLNTYRWYSSKKSQPQFANAVANISMMLITSHSLEILGGMGLATLGAAHGIGSVAHLAYTAVGVTVTIPGLDPLCLLTVAAYSRWPRAFDQALTKPRVFIMKSAKGVRSVFRKLTGRPENSQGWRERRFLRQLQQRRNVIKTNVADDQWIFQLYADTQTIEMKMVPLKNGEYALAQVRISSAQSDESRGLGLNSLLKPFGINIRDLINKLAKNMERGGSQPPNPYIRSMEVAGDNSSATFQLVPEAFPFRLMRNGESCEALLGVQ